jgi:CHRD domain-containing protein
MHAFLWRRLALRRALLVGTFLALTAIVTATADAATYSWSVPLSGQNVIASGLPAIASATGSASITGDDTTNTMCGTFSWSGVASPVLAGQIHEGESGEPANPAVTINLFGPDFPTGASSPVTGCATVPGALIDEMDRYSAYFNVVVSNEQYPAGAIRGQLGCATLLFNSTCPGF